ncbi:PilZ domain-containing protein [Fundidesulfovibrio soli]|uniref:PilZ domain-containing protein n=1 Tax=Fundidesulfovibrio soli TaxID=2922716 RepID=UPI001FAEE4D1|nr:PilZ domain-containing protein [Fundidesulfovibrio soli]
MEEDKRTFLRIPTNLRGRIRLLASDKELQLFREAPITSTSVSVMELKSAGVNEALVNALAGIDRKLDLLISVHSQDNLLDDFPHAVQIGEISGAGVKLTSTLPLEIGQMIECVITLTQVPIRMAGVIGRVVRNEDVSGVPGWAVDFTRVRDRDLESIVQFVFQTQRDELRVKMWE